MNGYYAFFSVTVFFCVGEVSPAAAMCTEPSTLSKEDGDYTLIGLYPAYISKGLPSGNGVMYMETVKFVLEEFNKRSPFKVGYRFYDTCGESNIHISAEISSDILLSASKTSSTSTAPTVECRCDNTSSNLDYVVGIVGPASSTVSEITANLLLLAELPIISYSSTSVKLNDIVHFPYFMRTIAADDYQSQVIFDLVAKFKWRYVSLIASDNLYGRSGTNELVELFKANGICLSVHKFFSIPYNKQEIGRIVEELNNDPKAEVVIVWALVSPSKMILDHASVIGMTNYTWVFTEGVGASNTFKYRDPDVVRGAFSIIPYSGYSSEFERYFFSLTYPEKAVKYSEDYWLQRLFQRYVLQNKTLEKKRSIFQTHKIGIIWNSVTAYLNSLTAYVADHHQQQQKNISVPLPLASPTTKISAFPKIADRKEFFQKYLLKIKFDSLDGKRFEFDALGNVKNQRYKILNIHVNPTTGTSLQEIGFWDQGKLTLNDSSIMWAGDRKPRSICSEECLAGHYPLVSNKVCCWKCLKCQKGFYKEEAGKAACKQCPVDTLPNANKTSCFRLNYQLTPYGEEANATVYVLSVFTGLLILCTLVVLFCFRQEKIVKALNFPLSVLQLVAQFVTISCGLLLTIEVTRFRCALYHYLVSFCTILVLAVILIKAEMILRIFNMRRRMSQREVFGEMKRQIKILILVLAIYLMLHGSLWNQYPVRVHDELNPVTYTLVRSCENSVQTVTSSLCIFILSMVCSVQVFRNRKLPSLYNEGKVIMYAVFALDVGIFVIIMITLIVRKDRRPLSTYYVFYAYNTWIVFVMFSGKVYRLLVPLVKGKSLDNNNNKKKGRTSSSAVADSRISFCIYEKNANNPKISTVATLSTVSR